MIPAAIVLTQQRRNGLADAFGLVARRDHDRDALRQPLGRLSLGLTRLTESPKQTPAEDQVKPDHSCATGREIENHSPLAHMRRQTPPRGEPTIKTGGLLPKLKLEPCEAERGTGEPRRFFQSQPIPGVAFSTNVTSRTGSNIAGPRSLAPFAIAADTSRTPLSQSS